jgi:hypothetical protein
MIDMTVVIIKFEEGVYRSRPLGVKLEKMCRCTQQKQYCTTYHLDQTRYVFDMTIH